MTDGDQKSNQQVRLGPTFHRSFHLVRTAVSDVLKVAGRNDLSGALNGREAIRIETHLGSVYIQAMPRYGVGSGLLNSFSSLSTFGAYALQYDSPLSQPVTQWLMHYHLSAPNGPGPVFWHELVKTWFRSGDEFSDKQIIEQISDIYLQDKGKSFSEKSARKTATAFLGTYTHQDCLGDLKIIEKVTEDRYQVLDPEPPETWVVGFGVLQWWDTCATDQQTINLSDLYGENGITDLFMIGRGRLNSVLEEMQQEGLIELYRVAPPYQVVMLRNDKEFVLRKIYGD